MAERGGIWLKHPELLERVKVMWAEGRSCTECARELGHGITRSAVIGLVHREALTRPGRATPAKYVRHPPKSPPVQQAPEPNRQRATIEPPPEAAKAGPVCLEDLAVHSCRWPINSWGTTQGAGAMFCGQYAPSAHPHRYCKKHLKASYAKPYGVIARATDVPKVA